MKSSFTDDSNNTDDNNGLSDRELLAKRAAAVDSSDADNMPSDRDLLSSRAIGNNIAPHTPKKAVMNINIGGQPKEGVSSVEVEPTTIDKIKHQASIYGKAAVTGPIAVPALASDAIPAVINASVGAYHDLVTPEGREAFNNTTPQMEIPSTKLENLLTDKQNNPLAFDKPQGKIEEAGTRVLNALTNTQAGIKSGVGLLSAFPKTQLASAVTSTTAGEIAKNQGYGPVGQTIASVVAGGATSIPASLSNTPEQIASSALKYTSGVEKKAAQELIDHSYAIGSPITAAEALAQVKGNSTLQPVQRVIEQSAGGGPTMEKFMQGRAEGNKSALNTSLNEIAPNPVTKFTDVSQIPLDMQKAAGDAIQDVKAQRSALTSPEYKAASDQTLSKDKVQPIMEALDREIEAAGATTDTGKALINYKNKLLTTVSTPITKNVESNVLDQFGLPVLKPETTIQNSRGLQTQIGPLETAYQETRNKLDLPIVSPNSLLNNVSGKLSPINYQLGQALSTNTNIAKGRNIHAKISESLVNPLEQGQMGQIANDSTMRGQGNLLLPTNPSAYDEKSVANTIGTLNKQNPDIAKSWVRQFLSDNFNEASQNLQSGKNQFGAAKFASNISGNSQQAKNLKAAIDSSTGGPDAYDGFKKMLNIFEAQGKRLQVGSPTTNNAEIISQLRGSPSDNILPGIIGSATGIASGAGTGVATGAGLKGINMLTSWYQNLKYGQNTGEMAKILTSPDGINKLQQLSKMKSSNPLAINLVRAIINPLPNNATNP